MKRLLPKYHPLDQRSKSSGFSLVEVVIAIAIVGLTFLAILGTLSVGVTSDQASSQQTVATNIAAAIMADLRSTPSYATPPTPTSQRYSLALPTTATATPLTPLTGVIPQVLYFDNSPGYLGTGAAIPTSAIYTAHVYLTQLTSAPQASYLVRLNVAWPAHAPSPVGSVDVVTQFIGH